MNLAQHIATQMVSLKATLVALIDGKAPLVHTHTTVNVTGLDTALSGKASTTHTHTVANVTGLQTTLDSKITSVTYATPTSGGTVKLRVDDVLGNLYLTTDGTNP